MTKMSKKDISNEVLGRMIAKGFENTATKDDIKNLKADLIRETTEIRQDLEDLELKIGNLAYAFDVKDLKKRMDVVERKIGIK
jgi:hypothetical protein